MFQINPAQKAQFDQHGFLVIEKLIDEATVDQLRACFDRLFAGEFETGVKPDEVNWQFDTGDPSLTRQICNGWKADRLLASVVLREDLGEAIARLGDWPGTRIMSDNVLWKPPAARALGYHQDSAFLSWYTPSDLVSCWIALDDTTADGGTLEFVRGSHRWHHSQPSGEFHGPTDYRMPLEKAASQEGVQPDIVHVEIAKGGCTFHHGWTWHGSGPNRTGHARRALVLHAMRDDAQYSPQHLGSGTGPVYGRYKRLGDNQLDENYFPILWSRQGQRTASIDDYLRSHPLPVTTANHTI